MPNLADLELSVRARNALREYFVDRGVREEDVTLGLICSLQRADVFRMPNVGRGTLKEIEEVLAQEGMTFGSRPAFRPNIPNVESKVAYGFGVYLNGELQSFSSAEEAPAVEWARAQLCSISITAGQPAISVRIVRVEIRED